MNNEKKLKTPKDYKHYSIRLNKEQKELVDSTGKGISGGIKEMIAFFKNWRNIDINIRADLKISCDEFSDLVREYIRANDAGEKNLATHYLELLRVHSQYIHRIHNHIDDSDNSFLQKHCFSDKGFFGYLEYFWKKEIPNTTI